MRFINSPAASGDGPNDRINQPAASEGGLSDPIKPPAASTGALSDPLSRLHPPHLLQRHDSTRSEGMLTTSGAALSFDSSSPTHGGISQMALPQASNSTQTFFEFNE